MLMVAATLMAQPKTEARYVICDSTNALLSGIKMEFLEINSIPLVSGFDGLIRFAFPTNVDSATVMLSGEGVDTLWTTLRHADSARTRWIIMKRKARSHHDDIYYTLGTMPDGKVMATRSAMLAKHMDADMAVSTESAEVATLAVEEHAAAVNSPQAGKLTAGEVNDFAKWHLWSRILDQTHTPYINTWRMRVRERYRVQVTNANRFPIADAQVQLVDNDGMVLFAARTDNTGHAELWANVLIDNKQTPKAIICTHGNTSDTIVRPLAFPKENLFVFDQACHAPEQVDVFFIMDATGSMGDELRYMNAELQDVIRRSASAVPGTTIRTGALVYRDHHDEYLNRLSPLTTELSTTQAFLNAQMASGGGDYEEAVPEALMAAINVADWSEEARARIAFLILDAPCHSDSATLALLHQQSFAAAQAGIRVVPVVCSGLREAGELLMRQLALLTNGTSFFLTDDSGIGDTHLKPTTDSLRVEHLNDMLVRTIIEFASMPACNEQWADSALTLTDEEVFLPNPFSNEDLDTIPAVSPQRPLNDVLRVRPNPCRGFFLADLPLGADDAYLVDITGKTLQHIGSIPAETRGLSIHVGGYATGVYFLKVFVEGRWYTRKVIVQ